MRSWWTEVLPLTCPMLICTWMGVSSPLSREMVSVQRSKFIWSNDVWGTPTLFYSDISVGHSFAPYTLWLCPSVRVRRCDCVDAHREHGLCGGSGGIHDPPQRPCHHGHAHLPSLPLLQTHRSSSRGRAHGEMGEREKERKKERQVEDFYLFRSTLCVFFFLDCSFSRSSEHSMGFLWWQEETGNPTWRQVRQFLVQPLLGCVPNRTVCVLTLPLFVCVHSIKITTSCYPVPSLCCHGLVYDWFESLAECLHWNIRKKQTHLSDASDSTDTDTWLTHSHTHLHEDLSISCWIIIKCSVM